MVINRKRTSWKLEAEIQDREIKILKENITELEAKLKFKSNVETPLNNIPLKSNGLNEGKKGDDETLRDGNNPLEAESPSNNLEVNGDNANKKVISQASDIQELNLEDVNEETEETEETEESINGFCPDCDIEVIKGICPECNEDFN